MQIKFLRSIVEHLAGKQAIPFVDLLYGKKDVNEFLIAKKLDLTINQTRNVLYKLSDFGLVSFIRKKDKRKGWYIYFWTLDISRSLDTLGNKLKQELSQLEHQLKSRREKRYYVCKTCGVEVTEEVALLNSFTCPECGEIYELSDNESVIKDSERDIIKVKKEFSYVNSEMEKETEKLDKKRERKIKKAAKEKALKRGRKRAETKKAKDKLKRDSEKKSKKASKKSGKKVSKKKVKTIKKKVSKKIKKKVIKKSKKLKKPVKKPLKKGKKK